MISYAQNFEDIMLWRALKHIEKGFYIDVGAWSPEQDSVTRHFYEEGWRGINIEPNPTFHALYKDKRPEDINLEVALSDEIGTAELYFSSNSGLSSLDASIANTHEAAGCFTIPATVHVTTLKDICQKYCDKQEIHFLKVDVEGLEKKVLLGNDWDIFRPWIVVVEATHPMSQLENHEEWEPILVNKQYQFVYADGLNRFYLALEHIDLQSYFKYPPNFFDNFVLIEEVRLKNQVQQIANDAQDQAQSAQEQICDLAEKLKTLQQNYDVILKSKSWKLTKPLRYCSKLFKR